MSPRPEDFLPLPELGPQPSPDFLRHCIQKMGDYASLAENSHGPENRQRALDLAECYAKIYRALKS